MGGDEGQKGVLGREGVGRVCDRRRGCTGCSFEKITHAVVCANGIGSCWSERTVIITLADAQNVQVEKDSLKATDVRGPVLVDGDRSSPIML